MSLYYAGETGALISPSRTIGETVAAFERRRSPIRLTVRLLLRGRWLLWWESGRRAAQILPGKPVSPCHTKREFVLFDLQAIEQNTNYDVYKIEPVGAGLN